MLALKRLTRTTPPPAISAKPIDSRRDVTGGSRPNPLWQSLALKSAGIQPKLNVSQPADPMEREADRIADQVMRTSTPRSGNRKHPFSSSPSPKAERKCAPCGEQEDKLQRSMQGDNASVSPVPPTVHEGLRSPGYPLEPRTQEFMEGRFGQDFDQVRVHVNERSSSAAQAIHAKAFTVGRDVVFGQGEYAPHTSSGRKLLAHELAHVAQQQTSAKASREVIHRQAIEDDKDYDVVKFGDRGEANLFRLSVAYGVSFSEVKRLNAHLEKENWTVRKGDLINLPRGTLVKSKQSELTHGVETAISSDSIPSEQRPDTSITSLTIPTDTSKTSAPKRTVVHQPPTVTKQKPQAPTTQTAAAVSVLSKALAHLLLHKYASFLPGTGYYVALDEEGLGKELATGYSKQPNVVLAVLDLTQWVDRDDVASELVSALWAKQLLDPATDTQMLKRLRTEIHASWLLSEQKKKQVHLLDMVLRIRGVSPLGEQGELSKKKKTGNSQSSQLAEDYGLEMIDESKYQAKHAYLPFKGKSGTHYEAGDVIAEEDRKAKYGGSSKPTWCNQFMMDLCKEILKKDIFKDAKSKNADGLIKYMKDTPESFEELVAKDESPFKQAWIAVNEGSLVFFGGPGHVSTGVPTPIDKLSSRTPKGSEKAYWFGEVIQAGASTGKMLLNSAWSKDSFPSLRAFKYIGEEPE